MNPWLYAETPVLSAFFLTCFAAWIRAQRKANDERDKAMAEQSKALAVLIESVRPLREWATRADTRFMHNEQRIGTLSETTAVLAASLDQHQNWHERQTRQRVALRDTIHE